MTLLRLCKDVVSECLTIYSVIVRIRYSSTDYETRKNYSANKEIIILFSVTLVPAGSLILCQFPVNWIGCEFRGGTADPSV